MSIENTAVNENFADFSSRKGLCCCVFSSFTGLRTYKTEAKLLDLGFAVSDDIELVAWDPSLVTPSIELVPFVSDTLIRGWAINIRVHKISFHVRIFAIEAVL